LAQRGQINLCHWPCSAQPLMAFHLPSLPKPLPPPPDSGQGAVEVAAFALQSHPALALVLPRCAVAGQTSLARSPRSGALTCAGKPVPLVAQRHGDLWMLDRITRLGRSDRGRSRSHHLRLCGSAAEKQRFALRFLASAQRNGAWLYLHDARGRGRLPPKPLPTGPGKIFQDDPYRSLLGPQTRKKRIAAAAV